MRYNYDPHRLIPLDPSVQRFREKQAREAQEAVAAAPTNAELRRDLAVKLEVLGERGGALQHLREAVRLAPTDPLLQVSLADHLARAGGELEAAVAGYRRALDLVTGLAAQDPAWAESWARAFMETYTRIRLGYALAEQGKVAEARTELEASLAAGQGYSDMYVIDVARGLLEELPSEEPG